MSKKYPHRLITGKMTNVMTKPTLKRMGRVTRKTAYYTRHVGTKPTLRIWDRSQEKLLNTSDMSGQNLLYAYGMGHKKNCLIHQTYRQNLLYAYGTAQEKNCLIHQTFRNETYFMHIGRIKRKTAQYIGHVGTKPTLSIWGGSQEKLLNTSDMSGQNLLYAHGAGHKKNCFIHRTCGDKTFFIHIGRVTKKTA